jgi:phosphate-selective porin OprO/OprP
LGEYTVSDQQLASGKSKIDAQNTAWQIEGGYVLTGEDATYYGVKPARPFDPLHGGGWGGFEIVGRYGQLEVDHKVFSPFTGAPTGFASAGSAREANAFSLGLNWYWNNNIRFSVDYAHTTFGGIAGSSASIPVTKGDENVIISRVQLAF